ncbi:hypothetical protein KP509_17G000600 [Ceratopteris richardii]|uniref:3'-5' exonuclease n=1 Tax=Ceratopteris richardii TaxID=49495 RepID=A0A8T2SUY9_CERRI|nr:hypothetical protein KP509_17G000600 [Ceratopteris richardii]
MVIRATSDVPFELVDVDEFEALEVAIGAAEQFLSSDKKCVSSISSCQYNPVHKSGSTQAALSFSVSAKFTCGATVEHEQSIYHLSDGERRSSSPFSLQTSSEVAGACANEHQVRMHLADVSTDMSRCTSFNDLGISSFPYNATKEGNRTYHCDARNSSHDAPFILKSISDGSIFDPWSSSKPSKAPSSPSGEPLSEEKEIVTIPRDETERNPRSTMRKLPSWHLYRDKCQVANYRRWSGLTRINDSLTSGDDEVEPASSLDAPAVNKRPWGLEPTTRRVVTKFKLPYLRFKGRIKYSLTVLDAVNAANDLLTQVEAKKKAVGEPFPIGFDTEWKVVFSRGAEPRKVAVLQLCIDADNCNVFHVIHTGIPSALKIILEDPLVSKVGVGAYGDARKLCRDYSIKVRGVKDLSSLANAKLVGTSYATKCWSLSSLSEQVLGKQIDKNGHIRMGDWEVNKLSEAQLQYAATDAFASLYLFQVLLTFPDPEPKVEPDSADGMMQNESQQGTENQHHHQQQEQEQEQEQQEC